MFDKAIAKKRRIFCLTWYII